MVPSFLFSRLLGFVRPRVRRRRRTQRGQYPPPDSNPFNDGEFGKNVTSLSRQFAASGGGFCDGKRVGCIDHDSQATACLHSPDDDELLLSDWHNSDWKHAGVFRVIPQHARSYGIGAEEFGRNLLRWQ